jgi:hypothetical protein
MSGTRLMSSDDARPVLRDQLLELLGDALRVHEEDAALRPRDEQPGEGLVVRVLGRERAQHVGPALAADRVHLRAPALLEQRDQRDAANSAGWISPTE